MDWTSVYVEDGNEDLIIPQLIQQRTSKGARPRLSRLVSRRYHHRHHEHREHEEQYESAENHRPTINEESLHNQEEEDNRQYQQHRLLELASYYYSSSDEEQDDSGSGYTLRALYFLSINFILGVGILGIPYAFAKAGFILSFCLLSIVTLFSYMTVMWVAETGARYEKQCLQITKIDSIKVINQKNSSENDGNFQSQSHESDPLVPLDLDTSSQQLYLLSRRYEVIDLVNHYLGTFQKGIYQIALLALMYVGLLAYSQVFCNAIAALLWSKSGVPQVIFGIMVIPLSCMELEEQVGIQSLMATIRFVAIFIIAFGSLMALFLDDTRSKQKYPPYFAQAQPEDCSMSYTACFSGFGVAFSTFLFAQLFQHSVPGLLRPLREQTAKIKQVPRILGGSLMTTSFLYILLGTLASAFFGSDTQSSINLNFAKFTFGVEAESASLFLCALLRICSSIVVMFPALDTISVFPLIANTLGNNLLSTYGTTSIRQIVRLKAQFSNERYDFLTREEKQRMLAKSTELSSILFRLVASFPPLLASIVATDLSFSLQLAGIAGIHVAFIAPSLLQISSIRQAGSDSSTIYTGWYSSSRYCIPVLLFATFSLIINICQIFE